MKKTFAAKHLFSPKATSAANDSAPQATVAILEIGSGSRAVTTAQADAPYPIFCVSERLRRTCDPHHFLTTVGQKGGDARSWTRVTFRAEDTVLR